MAQFQNQSHIWFYHEPCYWNFTTNDTRHLHSTSESSRHRYCLETFTTLRGSWVLSPECRYMVERQWLVWGSQLVRSEQKWDFWTCSFLISSSLLVLALSPHWNKAEWYKDGVIKSISWNTKADWLIDNNPQSCSAKLYYCSESWKINKYKCIS